MNIFVAGGAGYIGSHFCKIAHRAGHHVVVLDDLSTGHEEFTKWGELYRGSILDSSVIRSICSKHSVDSVVHFAAKSLVAESVAKPDLYQRNNVEGTRSLLAALDGTSVRHLIFSSTAATYGEPELEFIAEDTPQVPINPYGETKLACEKLILSQKKIRVGILRYFNVIGQDPEGELYEKHEPETHLIPNILKAQKSGATFGIFGDDYPTPDGTCVRDYVDVNDLSLVHLEALKLVSNSQTPLISNVGRGRGESIREVLNAFEKVFGSLPEVTVKSRRPGDPARLVASDKFFRTWCKFPLRSLEDSLRTMT